MTRGANCAAPSLISARRQCVGVPEMCVTPAETSRAKWSRMASPGRDRMRLPPASMARRKYLQSTIAPDIVKRCPDGAWAITTCTGKRPSERRQRMHGDFRFACRARCQHEPLRIASRGDRQRWKCGERRARGHNVDIEAQERRCIPADDRIDFGISNHRSEMLGAKVGWRQDQTPRHAVKSDQKCRRFKLRVSRDQHRTPGPTARRQCRGRCQNFGQSDAPHPIRHDACVGRKGGNDRRGQRAGLRLGRGHRRR